MRRTGKRSLLVGSRGGAARAVLALLAAHPLGRALASARERLLLVDAAGGTDDHAGPRPSNTLELAPTGVRDAADLAALVDAHAIDEVVDLAGLGTIDSALTCARAGASLVCTSLERWPQDRAEVDLSDAGVLLAPVSYDGSHLVGSGMNPGIVSALVPVAIAELARRVGAPARIDALDLHAILVTEDDTTECDDAPLDVFASTWSPQACLAELLATRAQIVRDTRVVVLEHAPCEASYRARCGDRIVEGWLVPHDELVTLGARHLGVELGFVYRVPPQARRFVETRRPRRDERIDTLRLWPPHCAAPRGRDRVGVLLCSRRHGELWCGFDTDTSEGLRFGTNATLLQVAAGVLAGWRALGTVPGLHVVEDLDATAFVEGACAVLGPYHVVHDRRAPPLSLSDRRVA